MFSAEIEKFNNRFEAIEEMLAILTDKVKNNQEDLMEGINAVLKTFAVQQTTAYERSMSMLECCHRAFKQVRDACETLREELSEASGTLIQSTYND